MLSKITVAVCLTLLSTIAAVFQAEDNSIEIEKDGPKIYYVKNGNSGKTILLLTGTLCCIEMGDLKSQLEHFGKDNTIIQMDLPGFGKSKPQGRDYSSNFYQKDAETVIKFMKALNIRDYLVLGFGYGGTVALYVASMETAEVVKGIAIWGAKSIISEKVVKKANELRNVDAWTKETLEKMKKIYGEKYVFEVYNKIADAFERLNKENNGEFCEETLKNITAPILVLHGTKDELVDQSHLDYILKHIKHAKSEIIEGSHELHQTKNFNKIVADFLLK